MGAGRQAPSRTTERRLGGLPVRPRAGHKGTFGTVCVVGGCSRGRVRYVGAPALAALGALRSGCGLCRVLTPEPVIQSVLRIASSATGVALTVGRDGGIAGAAAVNSVIEAADVSHALVVGPGLGAGPGVDSVVRRVWRGVGVPLVLDADGLSSLARAPELSGAGGPAVITPHPGEAERLMKAAGISGDPGDGGDRERIARALARRLSCVVVLKGSRTVVSDGERVYVNGSGGPWLATGGTGDVLAGFIGGLIAQHMAAGGDAAEIFRLACIGVLVHGRAGDAWAREKRATGGMLAVELTERLVHEVERMRR
ncbi:MAG TPA: NAD(P)H-hydrate dehydratase [Phycisphaerales bacterium]|nr:NAD(P)H-hydrate dehydratase [Phycisphaerales bacterium]